MPLNHNQPFRLLSDAYGLVKGLYRMVFAEHASDTVICILFRPENPTHRQPGGRPISIAKKRPKQTPKKPLVGSLSKISYQLFQELHDNKEIVPISLELHSSYYTALKNKKDQELFKKRCLTMQLFLDFEQLRESILVQGNIGELVRKTMEKHKVSNSHVRQLWSILCTYGFTDRSLRIRRDLCGAPGKKRLLSPNTSHQKSGRKTSEQRLNKELYGVYGQPVQPGINDDWESLIVAADKKIPIPKPSMKARYNKIINSHFATACTFDIDGKIITVDLKKGDYPNYQQVKRVLSTRITFLQKTLEKTSKGHFSRALRGMSSKSWEGVSGPGHLYAIDSTIGDIYLRSSLNPAWIVGRPIVYIIVDVWSTAIVGFYVCLTGPSWSTAQVSLFNTAAPAQLLSHLWDYEMQPSLFPAPTLPYALQCDRGEYLSKRAKATGMKLRVNLSYAPPFRPDLKGVVEVMHRILKNTQYNFLPGAMDARRAEYDLRRSNPAEATMTVRHYMQYLHECFFRYNLTANRSHRLDAHMVADHVHPSPAGLWRWGHAMGIGYSKAQAQAELTCTLLPLSNKGRVSRSGISFCGNDYRSEITDAEQWSTIARTSGHGWQIPVHYYPGSVAKIWTPNVSGNGLIDLDISDLALTSALVTHDEMADAFAYQRLRAADIEHENTVASVLALKRMQAIKAESIEQTRIALGRARGRQPSITEARAMEVTLQNTQSVATICGTSKIRSEADQHHLEMMEALFGDMNEGSSNEE